jgi:predicted ferric reductase
MRAVAFSAPVLVVLYLCVALFPLALSSVGARPPRPVWDELASGAGMLAFAVILMEFVLSGRFRTVSGRIGMDVTMRFHQLVARTALVLVLAHPFLYTAPFNPPRPWDASRQLTLAFDAGALDAGLAAWILLGVLVAVAIGRRQLDFRYETWRLIHGIGALLVAGFTLRHALGMGRYSADPVLAWFWIALTAAAALTLVQVYVLKPLLLLRRPWTVREVRRIGDRTWEVTLDPRGHDGMAYEAGQFAWLNIGHTPFSLFENPFSISSAPGPGRQLQFVIKELGDFTRSLGGIKPGTRAFVDGPYGNLTAARHREPGIALIAGGVGIAPLLGIMRQLRHDGDGRPAKIVYGNRIREQIVYADELDEFARQRGSEVVHVLSEPPAGWTGRTGIVDAELIRSVFGAPEMRDWLFVLCGPAAMMEAVEDALIGLGVPADRIESERFQYD